MKLIKKSLATSKQSGAALIDLALTLPMLLGIVSTTYVFLSYTEDRLLSNNFTRSAALDLYRSCGDSSKVNECITNQLTQIHLKNSFSNKVEFYTRTNSGFAALTGSGNQISSSTLLGDNQTTFSKNDSLLKVSISNTQFKSEAGLYPSFVKNLIPSENLLIWGGQSTIPNEIVASPGIMGIELWDSETNTYLGELINNGNYKFTGRKINFKAIGDINTKSFSFNFNGQQLVRQNDNSLVFDPLNVPKLVKGNYRLIPFAYTNTDSSGQYTVGTQIKFKIS